MSRDITILAILLWPLLLIPSTTVSYEANGKIAFYSNRSGRDDIYIMNANGDDVQLVTTGEYGGKCPDLSADGSQIVFVSLRDGNSELYVIDITTGAERRLTYLPSVERQPKWSPDGRRIAFQSDRDGNYEIYTMDAIGTNWQRLTFSDAEELWPEWSPDGHRLVFNSFRDDNWEIYIVDSDGTDLRRLTNTPDVNETGGDWSPDGRNIAFRSGPPRQFQGNIHVISADGTNETELTDFDGVEENPIWSPDGKQIVFQSMMSGDFELYVMDADGSNLRNLTNNPAHDYWPSWVAPGISAATVLNRGNLLSAGDVELTILYDDVSRVDGMTSGRGFSCLVKAAGKRLLFDAGNSGQLLMSNMAAGACEPDEIDVAVISHCNSDHIGGLPSVLSHSGKTTKLYLPGKTLPNNISGRALEIIPAKIDSAASMVDNIVYLEAPESICTGVMSTGPLGDDIPEQSLLVLTDAGVVVITGCAHPGISRIVHKASELTGEPILLVIGGFHLGIESQEIIDGLALELDGLVEYVAPCHCTGDLARQCFRQRFGDHYSDVGAGSVIRVADLATRKLD